MFASHESVSRIFSENTHTRAQRANFNWNDSYSNGLCLKSHPDEDDSSSDVRYQRPAACNRPIVQKNTHTHTHTHARTHAHARTHTPTHTHTHTRTHTHTHTPSGSYTTFLSLTMANTIRSISQGPAEKKKQL